MNAYSKYTLEKGKEGGARATGLTTSKKGKHQFREGGGLDF